MGHEPAILVPKELLQGQPTHSLNEAALHLADVDRGVDRVAGVMQEIGAQQFPFAGERVDDHFRDRSA